MDLVGPLPTAQGGSKFAVVAVEYFTRWIEAKPLTSITSDAVKKFFWQNIICRFGVPKTLTVDNGKQFDSEKFKEYCKSMGTSLAFASVYHPDSIGAAERANREIFSAISRTLFNLRKGKGAEELPKVVWSHNTTTTRATGYTSFKLMYREEAMMPEEIKHQSLRATSSNAPEDKACCKQGIEQERLQALENILKYQDQTKTWRDKNIARRLIEDGDLVLRRRPNADMVGKLQPKWEGPYIAKAIAKEGAFKLEDGEGRPSTHTWNASSLKKFMFDVRGPPRNYKRRRPHHRT